MPSVREDVEVSIHEHRFLVTKLLESLSTASLYVSAPFSRNMKSDQGTTAALVLSIALWLMAMMCVVFYVRVDRRRRSLRRACAP